jgi:large subunit ribosomal protein L10
MVTKMVHIAPWKEREIKDLKQLITDKPVIGLVNIKGIPGPQMQKMRKNLRNKAVFKVSKLKLLLIALEEMESEKEGIIELVQSLDGQMGIIGTDMNPFKLFQVLEASKTAAPVKGGESAPDDIDIKAGETQFKPGPIVGDLQRVGIPSAIEQGKVIIKADKTVVKAGETISSDLAKMLTRLEIYPLTVGLDLSVAFENGTIFEKKELDIDIEQFMSDLNMGASSAFNLAFNINYVNSMTVFPLLQTAHTQALNLMLNANIISPSSIEFLLSKSTGQMLSLASQVSPEALDDELNERVSGTSAPAPVSAPEGSDEEPKDDSKPDETKPKKKEEEKEVSEEEAAAGLGALFD